MENHDREAPVQCGSRSAGVRPGRPFARLGRVFALWGKGCLPKELFRSGTLPHERRRARAGWAARGQQDAPGPRPARVRVCARWRDAGRVHGTGETRARVGPGCRAVEGRRCRVKKTHKTQAQGTQRTRRAVFAPSDSMC